MRWPDARIRAFLAANTAAARRVFPPAGRPRLRHLVRLHLVRGGLWDHVLAFWLVPLTLGLSAWAWARFRGSCCFAGHLDDRGRVGCLIHPLRIGGQDLRRHAFPLVPTAGCNRALRCPMLDDPGRNGQWDALEASRRGRRSLGRR